jgi:CRP-like cAMP-binding protein
MTTPSKKVTQKLQSVPQPIVKRASAQLKVSPHHYWVFASDRQVYGPATTSTLQEWASQGLISTETWIFHEELNSWKLARHIKDLKASLPQEIPVTHTALGDITLEHLRRIRVFGDMDDHQLEQILSHLMKVEIPALRHVVHKGEHGSSFFLLFTGEATVSTKIDGVQKTLQSLHMGDFFGESTIVEVSPRPYDVKANVDCTFLLLKHSEFQKLLKKQPDIAARFLTAIVKHLSYLNLNSSTRFAQAKALSRNSLNKTGKIDAPPVIFKRSWN